ncbi:MAG TPA: hypothetical protein VIT93_02165 [Dehalococcoidia bacterium]
MKRSFLLAGAALLLLAALSVSSGNEARAASTTVDVSWGPFNVPAAGGGGPGNYDTLAFSVAQPCTDCYITSIVPNLVYADGSTANFDNMAMMHHVVVVSTSATDVTCAGTPLGSLGTRLFASGNERTVLQFPPGYGLYNPAGPQWHLIMHLMNMKPEARDMYMEFTFTYVPGSDNLKPVTPVWLDVDNCDDSEYSVPVGESDTHWDWTSTITGDLVTTAGHVHDYGINLAVEDVATGEYLCNSVAGYASGSAFAPAPVAAGDEGHPAASLIASPGDPAYMGHIEDMTGCSPMHRLTIGDTVRLHSRYNAPAAKDDMMGIAMAFVHETTDPPDADSDTVPDESDNCPWWPNPGQGMPPWTVPAGDHDCDGFSTASENAIGSNPAGQCGFTGGAPTQSETWPPDLVESDAVDIFDVLALKLPFGMSVPAASARFDLVPNSQIDIFDVLSIKSTFGMSCTP